MFEFLYDNYICLLAIQTVFLLLLFGCIHFVPNVLRRKVSPEMKLRLFFWIPIFVFQLINITWRTGTSLSIRVFLLSVSSLILIYQTGRLSLNQKKRYLRLFLIAFVSLIVFFLLDFIYHDNCDMCRIMAILFFIFLLKSLLYKTRKRRRFEWIQAGIIIGFILIRYAIFSYESSFLFLLGLLIQVSCSFLFMYSFFSHMDQEKSGFDFPAYLLVVRKGIPILFVLLVTISCWNFFLKLNQRNEKKKDLHIIKLLSNSVEYEFEQLDRIIHYVGDSTISHASERMTVDMFEAHRQKIAGFVKHFTLDYIYILDLEGNCIFSAQPEGVSSIEGNNYAYRPYFVKAVQGYSNRYFALGATTKIPGVFVAHPVRDEIGHVICVLVLKRNVNKLQGIFNHYPSCSFISKEGIIFLTEKKELLYSALWPLAKKEKDSLIKSRQFGTIKENSSLFESRPVNGEIASLLESIYMYRQYDYAGSDWSVVVLKDLCRSPYALIYVLPGLFFFLLSYFIFEYYRYLDEKRHQKKNSMISLIESFQLGIFKFSNVDEAEQTRISSLNPAMVEMLGYQDESELIGKSPLHLVKDMDSLIRVRRFLANKREVRNERFTLSRFNGENLYVTVSTKHNLDANGRLISITGVAQDISDRYELETRFQLFAKAFECSPTMISIFDQSGDPIYVNPKFTRISGYDQSDLDACVDIPVLQEMKRILMSNVFQSQLRTVGVWEQEQQSHTKEGVAFWEAVSVVPIYSSIDNKHFDYFVRVGEDISLQKKALEKMNEQQRQLEHKNRELHCLFDINSCLSSEEQELEDIISYIEKNLVKGFLFSEYVEVHIQMRTDEKKQSAKRLRHQSQVWVSKHGKTFGCIAYGYSSIPSSFRDFAFGEEEEAMVKLVAKWLSDYIVKKENAENRMIRNLALESSLNAFVISDFKTGITYINEAFAQLTGYKQYELPGKNIGILFQSPREYSNLLLRLRQSHEFRGEFCFRKKDGARFYCRFSASIVEGAKDGKHQFNASFSDITERIEKEHALLEMNLKLKEANQMVKEKQSQLIQQEKLASIGQLAAGVAHELNNPIGFISSNFETLLSYFESLKKYVYEWRSAKTEPAMSDDIDFILEDLPEIYSETNEGFERVNKIVKSLRSFSRVDRFEKMEYFNLNDGIESTLVVAKNEIKYVADVHMALEDIPLVQCNSGEINQVILNLLVNAAQAIKSMGLKEKKNIFVKTYVQNEDVFCEIRDEGPGIPPDILPNIFDPFFTTKKVGEGTGLGLNISYDIVANKHKGNLSVHSVVGEGSTFVIQIPIKGKKDEQNKGSSGECPF